MVAFAQVGVIERMLQSGSGEMTREAASAVLQWRMAEGDQAKVSQLSAKARAGTLTPEEASELDWYLLLGDFLSVVQSKARVTLGTSGVTR